MGTPIESEGPKMPRLHVNVDHVATLRQARREAFPDPVEWALRVEAAGPVTSEGRELRIPLRLVEEGSGRKIELSLRVTIDA